MDTHLFMQFMSISPIVIGLIGLFSFIVWLGGKRKKRGWLISVVCILLLGIWYYFFYQIAQGS